MRGWEEESGKCGGRVEVERLRGCEMRVKRFIASWKLYMGEEACIAMHECIITMHTHTTPLTCA